MRTRDSGIAIVAASVALLACGDDPFAVRWAADPDTVQLHALSRPEPNLLSAFDFYNRAPKRLEAVTTGNQWDLVTDVREGQFVWLPPGALDISSDAGLATSRGSDLRGGCPGPCGHGPLREGRADPDPPGPDLRDPHAEIRGSFSTCNYYGKIEVLESDPVAGTIRFQFDVNRVCNSLDLIPPD